MLVVAAAPFLNSASAAQPAGDATAVAETAEVTPRPPSVDPALWVNPQDPTKSMILAANGTDGLGVYDMAGAKVAQTGVNSAAISGVDTRNGFTLGGSPVSVATAVGEGGVKHGLMHFYIIDPATGKLTNKSATAAGIDPPGGTRATSAPSACTRARTRTTPTPSSCPPTARWPRFSSSRTPAPSRSRPVRGYGSTPTAPVWDVSAEAAKTVAGCVADDEMKTLYVSRRRRASGSSAPSPATRRPAPLIDTPTTATPAGHLTDTTLGLALAKTGVGAGYLIASSPAKVGTDPMADSFMVYDRAAGNAFVRPFHVAEGALDNCEQTDGIDAAAGNFGTNFPSGMFVCQDQTNENSGSPNGKQNYKLVARAADRRPGPAGDEHHRDRW